MRATLALCLVMALLVLQETVAWGETCEFAPGISYLGPEDTVTGQGIGVSCTPSADDVYLCENGATVYLVDDGDITGIGGIQCGDGCQMIADNQTYGPLGWTFYQGFTGVPAAESDVAFYAHPNCHFTQISGYRERNSTSSVTDPDDPDAIWLWGHTMPCNDTYSTLNCSTDEEYYLCSSYPDSTFNPDNGGAQDNNLDDAINAIVAGQSDVCFGEGTPENWWCMQIATASHAGSTGKICVDIRRPGYGRDPTVEDFVDTPSADRHILEVDVINDIHPGDYCVDIDALDLSANGVYLGRFARVLTTGPSVIKPRKIIGSFNNYTCAHGTGNDSLWFFKEDAFTQFYDESVIKMTIDYGIWTGVPFRVVDSTHFSRHTSANDDESQMYLSSGYWDSDMMSFAGAQEVTIDGLAGDKIALYVQDSGDYSASSPSVRVKNMVNGTIDYLNVTGGDMTEGRAIPILFDSGNSGTNCIMSGGAMYYGENVFQTSNADQGKLCLSNFHFRNAGHGAGEVWRNGGAIEDTQTDGWNSGFQTSDLYCTDCTMNTTTTYSNGTVLQSAPTREMIIDGLKVTAMGFGGIGNHADTVTATNLLWHGSYPFRRQITTANAFMPSTTLGFEITQVDISHSGAFLWGNIGAFDTPFHIEDGVIIDSVAQDKVLIALNYQYGNWVIRRLSIWNPEPAPDADCNGDTPGTDDLCHVIGNEFAHNGTAATEVMDQITIGWDAEVETRYNRALALLGYVGYMDTSTELGSIKVINHHNTGVTNAITTYSVELPNLDESSDIDDWTQLAGSRICIMGGSVATGTYVDTNVADQLTYLERGHPIPDYRPARLAGRPGTVPQVEARNVAECTPETEPQRPYSRGGAARKWRELNGIPLEIPVVLRDGQ